MFSCDIKFIIATVRPKNKTPKTIKNGLLIDKISQVHKYTRNHETSYSRNLSAMYGCLEQTSNQHLSIVDTSNQYGRIYYKMGDTVLGTTVKEKDLGVTISADMKVSEQCGIAASKGNQILVLIRRNITYKGKKLIIPLYKAIVRPHLEYCIQAWRPYRKKDIDTLERIQRRATKMIPELRDLSYEERLKECGLTTLETRRLRGDQIEVFKILNGYKNIDRNMFFSLKKDSRTRGRGKISKGSM